METLYTGVLYLVLPALCVGAVIALLRKSSGESVFWPFLMGALPVPLLGWSVFGGVQVLAPIGKSPSDRGLYLVRAGVLFGTVLLGMLAQEIYRRPERRRRQAGSKLSDWLQGMLVAPIVSVPLIDLVDRVDLSPDKVKLFVTTLVMAYQTGFFWKDLFEQRRTATGR